MTVKLRTEGARVQAMREFDNARLAYIACLKDVRDEIDAKLEENGGFTPGERLQLERALISRLRELSRLETEP